MGFLVSVGDTLRVRIGTYTATQAGINTLALAAVDKTGDISDVQQSQFIASALAQSLAPLYKPLMAADATFQGLSIQTLNTSPKPLPEVNVAEAGVGTAGGDLLPGQASGVLTLKTAFAGPRYRGRIYIPWAAENDNDAGKPTAGYITRLDLLGTYLSAQIVLTGVAGTLTLEWVVWHRDLGVVTRIDNFRSNMKWGTQKRRGDYGQRNIPPF